MQNNQSMTLEYIPKPDDGNLIQFRKSFDEGGKTWANRIYKFIERKEIKIIYELMQLKRK